VIVLRADRWVDITAGDVRSPAVIVVEGNRIAAVNPTELPTSITEIDLGDVTLLPGLMDMELNMLIGGPETPTGLPLPMHGVQDDPVYRTLRGTVNAKTTLLAGFTTVRNLGLMVKTDGYLLDVDLGRAIDAGFVVGPRIVSASQISPRLGIRISLDRGEFSVHPHALFPHSLRDFGQPLGPQPRRRLPVHAPDGNPNVLGPRDPKPIRVTAALIQQLIG
jgi:hypothetical protein